MKDAFLLAASVGAVVSIISFLLFQLFPRQILGLFGSGSEEYFQFGVSYFRIFLFFTWLNFAADLLNLFQFYRKSIQGNFSFPDQTDSVPAAARGYTATFLRYYGRFACRTDRRSFVLYRWT